MSNENSTVTVYISSHAGEEFIKIQDTDVITTEDFARAIMEMYVKKRYKKLGIFLDTCRAFTFFKNMEAPNVFMIASSAENENAVSHEYDVRIGQSTKDTFTHFFVKYMEENYTPSSTLMDMHRHMAKIVTSATVKYKSTMDQDVSKVKMSEFWGLPGIDETKEFKYVGKDEFNKVFA